MTGPLIELRRGPGPWAAVALAIAGVVYVVSRLETLTLWSDTTAAVASASYLMGPVAAGISAWAGGRAARRELVPIQHLAAKGAVAAATAEVGALVVWTLSAYLALVLVLFTLTAPQATWGGPSWLWIAAAAVGLATFCPLGWAAGRLLPLRFTPFGVAVAFFALGLWADLELNAWWERLLPSAVWLWTPFDELRNTPLWGQLAWYFGLTAAVFAAFAAITRARVRVVAMLSTAAVAGMGVGLVLIAPDPRFAIFAPIEWTCVDGTPQVCVHPAYTSSLPQLRERAEAVAGRLNGTPFAVARVEQRPRGGPAPPDQSGTAVFAFDAPRPHHYDRAAFEMATSAFDVGNSCFPDPNVPPKPGLRSMFLLVNWAAGLDVDPVGAARTTAWTWMSGQSPSAVQEWINAHADAIRSCSLDYADFT